MRKWSRALRRGTAAVGVAVAVVACSPAAGDGNPAAATGVSDAMLADAARFQLPGGLFVMPEAAAAGVSSFQATAPYAAVASGLDGVVDWSRAAANPLPGSADLAEADAYLQVVGAAGTRSLDADVLDRLSAAITAPPVQADAGAEIGALWLWTDAVSRLDALGGTAGTDPGVAARLAAVPSAQVAGHPYLVERLGEVYAHLQLAPPSTLQAEAVGLPATDTAAAVTSSSGVLDLLAVVRARLAAGRPAGLTADDVRGLVDTTGAASSDDDLLRASVIEIAAAAGASDQVAALTGPLRDRLDAASGLLAPSTASQGSVDATYLFARLVDLRFAEIASTATRDALATAAADGQQPVGARLEAVAALKQAGDGRWEQFRALATQVAATQPRQVDEAALAGYLQVMEPAVQVDPGVGTAALTAFDPGSDEATQRQAWAALRLSYLFSNSGDVASMFAGLQRQMKGWADDPSTPFPQLLAAASIIPSSGVVSVDSTYLEKLGDRIAAHRGCHGATTFFALDGTTTGVCSVILTLQARGVPGGA